MARHIGTLRESSLHTALKNWYAQEGDSLETWVDGYVVDLVRGDELIEIQTGNFATIRNKVKALVEKYRLRLVYPVAVEKWIVRTNALGAKAHSRRKSPKQGRMEDLFKELVYFPALAKEAHFALEIILIQREDVWVDDGQGSWRRGRWSIGDRRLLGVLGRRLFCSPSDYVALLPQGLPARFTCQDLSQAAGISTNLASKMAYCLERMGAVKAIGKRGRARLYAIP